MLRVYCITQDHNFMIDIQLTYLRLFVLPCRTLRYVKELHLLFQALLRSPPVMVYVRNFDYKFYQNLVDVLIPDVLRSIPSSLTQAIRNFAKSLESWLYNAMLGCPQELVNIKVCVEMCIDLLSTNLLVFEVHSGYVLIQVNYKIFLVTDFTTLSHYG